MAYLTSSTNPSPKLYLCMAVFVAIGVGLCSAGDCYSSQSPCEWGYSEVFRDDAKRKTTYQCCVPDTDAADKAIEAATSCTATQCVPIAQSGLDLCSFKVGTRTISDTGEQIRFVEAIRDECRLPRGNAGLEALCCGENTLDLTLTSLLGEELHEFPHFARLEIRKPKGVSYCGATVYNERFIITASHCVVNKQTRRKISEDQMTIFLDIAIQGKRSENEYKVEEVIVHENSSLLAGRSPTNYDVALLRLNRNIIFSDRVQALPLPPSDFVPTEYADTAVIAGFGKTDTLTSSKKLQKADAYIRDPMKNTAEGSRYPNSSIDVDQLLFLGGFQDGIRSPGGSKGDSGGPAVCRDKDGKAVLCGITSFGSGNAPRCEKYKNEKECFATVYAKVSHFRNWIVRHAGDQTNARVMNQPLYGKIVQNMNYPHQVSITSANKNDHTCGGTLIAKNVVLTAAHCVVEDNGVMKQGLTVTRTVKGKPETESVKRVEVFPGFRKVIVTLKDPTRPKRIAVFGTQPTLADDFYFNDIALVKLNKPMSIPQDRLPTIPVEEAEPGPATELAWVTDKRRKGKLSERRFNLMTHAECQKRMDRLSYAGYNVRVSGNIVCGVENYSGGSKCDRTLGGGVICEDNTLCGVQVFRLCQFAVPNAFMDVGLKSAWIQKTVKSL